MITPTRVPLLETLNERVRFFKKFLIVEKLDWVLSEPSRISPSSILLNVQSVKGIGGDT